MRGTSPDKIYHKLGLEPLKFYKIFTKKSLLYLFDWITNLDRAHNTRLSDNISAINVRYGYFKSSFFTSAISKWNKFNLNIRNPGSLNIFKKSPKLYTTFCKKYYF